MASFTLLAKRPKQACRRTFAARSSSVTRRQTLSPFTKLSLSYCPSMAEKRKRKIDDECRQFKEEWKLKYFFIKSGEKALCVICNETVAVMKEFNMQIFQSKHQEKYAQLEGEVRAESFSNLQNAVA